LSPDATYTSSTYGFSLDYLQDYRPDTSSGSSVGSTGSFGDGWYGYSFTGSNAAGRSAEQVVQDVQQAKFPGATAAYPAQGIPGADLGYTPGYGQVYDVFAGGRQTTHARVVILAAIRGNLAVAMAGEGPFSQSSESTTLHASPADVLFVLWAGYDVSVTSVRWPGEAPF
jgi:hypothetical protein